MIDCVTPRQADSAESSIGSVTDSPHPRADELLTGAVEALPVGRLAEQVAEGNALRVKLGIDPTAPDIHLGHCVVLDKLADFQRAGHEVVLIIGDYTAMVGDPSGRDTQRPILSAEEIAANAATFEQQAFKILDEAATTVRFNSEWLEMPTHELFRLARAVTVAQVLERDDFAKRMAADKPISILETLYPLLQGYDSVAVEADVELGGTDQKFNLLLARDVQRSYGVPEQSILCMPILPGIDGKQRMSKSLGNYVGITEVPEEMFGKLMSIPDDAMPDYYAMVLREEFDPEEPPNLAKRRLAGSVVERFHGRDAARGAEEKFDAVHVRHEVPGDVPGLSLAGAVGDAEPVHLPALIASAFELSTSEARRLLSQGGVRLDGEVLAADLLDMPSNELTGRTLQAGKRRFVSLEP